MIPSSVTHIADHAPITLHSPPLGQSSLRWKAPVKITWFSWCCSIISLCVMFCGCCLFFCPFLAIVLSALLQLKASDYPLGIFKLFLISSCEVETLLRSGDFIGDIKYSCQNQSKCFKMVTWLPVDPLVMSREIEAWSAVGYRRWHSHRHLFHSKNICHLLFLTEEEGAYIM